MRDTNLQLFAAAGESGFPSEENKGNDNVPSAETRVFHMSKVTPDLTERVEHFDFGKNWAGYSELIDQDRIELATRSVHEFLPDIRGKTFLDIGSGSGLFSLAALRLGAARVHAIDLDEDSVATTKRVLSTFGDDSRWSVERRSVFELSADELGLFDIVYTWGVLHHTGDMWRAMERASEMVAPGGVLAFALYERTPLCGAWRFEKRAYMRAPARIQKIVMGAYIAVRKAARFMSGKGGKSQILERGMNLAFDAHDWLGGYPYESTDPDEVFEFMTKRKFVPVLQTQAKIQLAGLLGTGCSEYKYSRQISPATD